MTHATPEELPATCPSCGAAVRQSVPWCLQCYASLRAEPERQPEPAPEPQPDAGERLPEDGGPRPGSGAPVDVDAVAERMLAELRASRPADGRWALPTTRGGRTAAIVGLLVALGLVFVLALTVLGHLL